MAGGSCVGGKRVCMSEGEAARLPSSPVLKCYECDEPVGDGVVECSDCGVITCGAYCICSVDCDSCGAPLCYDCYEDNDGLCYYCAEAAKDYEAGDRPRGPVVGHR